MRILFVENVPRDLKKFFPGQIVLTVQEMGWGSFKNGALLALANKDFDVFMTVDKNMKYQNKLHGLSIIHVTLASKFVRVPDLVKLVPGAMQQIKLASPGDVIVVSPEGFE